MSVGAVRVENYIPISNELRTLYKANSIHSYYKALPQIQSPNR